MPLVLATAINALNQINVQNAQLALAYTYPKLVEVYALRDTTPQAKYVFNAIINALNAHPKLAARDA